MIILAAFAAFAAVKPVQGAVRGGTPSVLPSDQDSLVRNVESKGHWVALPAFFYTPETGFGGGPAVGYIFPRRGGRHPSSLMGTFFYTEKRQTILALAPQLYAAGGFHGVAELGYQKFPNSFWGIGDDTEAGDEETYTPEFVNARLVALFEIFAGLRAGAQVMYRREVMLESETGGVIDAGEIPGSVGGTTAGAGIVATYDTRDNIFGSYRGWYAEVSHGTYGGFLGSDFDFSGISLDIRNFFLLSGTHVLAARIFARATYGTVPFQEMPALGGPSDMRGYQEGRYRDGSAAFAQVEYRFPLVWRLRGAVFGSAGNVARRLPDFDMQSVKYAGGGGVRFLLNEERFSIRLDSAVTGEGGSNFYFTINEAF